MKRPEETLQRQVASYLSAIPGLLWWATANQRGTRSRAEMGVLKAMGVRAGVSDLHFLLPGGKLGVIELKAGKGVLTPAQRDFIQAVQEAGGKAAVCRTLDDVATTINAWLGPYGYRVPRVAA